ncbi:nucleoside-diphosphate-sugar epimerase [Friedmanniella endophytica]|uniref:Nucleoside-diphosphate-sugar epimerase n=1 Tax=Microlunatus kandeliicorticis TaxID=1759536 RepID=A0A7W3IU66_9ACTN|nr:NAD-dependent epimerase/dehydratase family protein [Microlunatus kandeliicorticis]MBA8795294.1 nucleoside-diphosphate-sugar epimerase [Microlunatus kandeliicorticis]
MRVVVIGSTGHVGSYLVPRLVRAGHEVVAVSRGRATPYHDDPAWDEVERVVLDRDALEAEGRFGAEIAGLRGDAVIDMICFTADSATQLVKALRGSTGLHAHCGTIWTHGLSTTLPMREDDPKHPFGDYGVQKKEIEDLLLAESRSGGLASTVIHPGHISGPGWPVINPVGNLDPTVWTTLATGGRLRIPGSGSETMHHVHADDVAQLFELAVAKPEVAAGESFHALSEQALTVRGFAEGAAAWFGREADLEPVSWEAFRAGTDEGHADASWQHLHRSQVGSIEKPKQQLGYRPAYSSLDAARQAVASLAERGQVDLGGATLTA